ncbi:Golgi-associated PDZ and coiled-coil motif-containing protein-like isoform X1 [Argiope bruennichi]|uniref:Golgi-associated PDZ and coiled-coil motif-containing protein-like isoform X1 n=1 Tax=Argiope bruennichi TaxID=94029 RepID=UPI0024954E26|nr:Golgi-associated PDZ and coiled-coil motif-containing protein-like isoform X1 [Argiope bruennichi]
MAIGTTGIQWLDLLESEFDKSFVDLDMLIGEIDEDQIEIIYAARQKLTALSTAFAQLSHKSQVVFENSMKLEKELINTRQELCEAQAARMALQKELQHLLLQLHSAQLQVSAQMGHAEDSEAIQQKLENEMENYRSNIYKDTLTESQIYQLKRENELLRQCNVALQSEVFGSRLAAKYLDKELAGRIQQIQLLGRDLKCSDHNRLWEQLEAEIHLHRHKTVIRACRAQKGLDSKLLYPPGHDFNMLRKKQGVGEIRVVELEKKENEGLGISITGGREHAVPIVISEIHPHLPAWRSGKLFIGDAILSVNGIDLRNMRHMEAAQVLSNQQGQIKLEVVFVSPDEEWNDETENGDFQFNYPFYNYHTTCQLSKFLNKNMTDKGTDPIESFESNSTNDISSLNNNPSEPELADAITDEKVKESMSENAEKSEEESQSSHSSPSLGRNSDKENEIETVIVDRHALNSVWRSLMFEKGKSEGYK